MESCSLAVKWHDAIKCSVCIFMQLNITIRWVGRARKRESVKHFFRQRKWKLVSRLCNAGQRRTLGMLTHKEEEEERILVIFSIIISQRISFCLDSFNEKISIFVFFLNLSDSREKKMSILARNKGRKIDYRVSFYIRSCGTSDNIIGVPASS